MVQPAFCRARFVAGTGPMPIMEGSTPAWAQLATRARTGAFRRAASSAVIRTRAAAPSLIPLALAAVTVPSFLKAGRTAETLDRKSTRLNPVTNAHLVCRLLLEKKKNINTFHQ